MIRTLSALVLSAVATVAQAGLPTGKVVTIKAYIDTFSCGDDACYLLISKDGGEKIQAICSSAKMCGVWLRKTHNEEELHIGLKAQLTLKSEYFSPAGENFWHVKKVSLLR